MDDGSSPPVKPIVDIFNEPRIRYFYQENQGGSSARNKGVRLAQGDYIAFLDDDDEFLPQKLKLQVDLLNNTPSVGMALGGFNVIDHGRKLSSEARPWEYDNPNTLETWLFHCPTVTNAVMIRKSWFEKVGGFDESQHYVEDWDLWLRMVYAGCQIQYVQEILANYLISFGGVSSNTSSVCSATIRMLNKFFKHPNLPGEIKGLQNSALASVYLTAATREYEFDLITAAKSDLCQAYSTDLKLKSDPELFVNAIYDRAVGPYITIDPHVFVKRIFDNLPSEAEHFRKFRRKVFSMVHLCLLFQARKNRNWRFVRKNAVAFFYYSPNRILDRGVLSSLFKAPFIKRTS